MGTIKWILGVAVPSSYMMRFYVEMCGLIGSTPDFVTYPDVSIYSCVFVSESVLAGLKVVPGTVGSIAWGKATVFDLRSGIL